MLNLFKKKQDDLSPLRRSQIESLTKYRGQKAKVFPTQPIGLHRAIEYLPSSLQYIEIQKQQ